MTVHVVLVNNNNDITVHGVYRHVDEAQSERARLSNLYREDIVVLCRPAEYHKGGPIRTRKGQA